MNSHLPLSIKIAFSKPMCVLIAATVVIPFWILFNFLDQLIFFEPIWIFYLPEDALIGFILTTLISILIGILVSINIYVIRHSGLRISRKSLFSGLSLNIISSVWQLLFCRLPFDIHFWQYWYYCI